MILELHHFQHFLIELQIIKYLNFMILLEIIQLIEILQRLDDFVMDSLIILQLVITFILLVILKILQGHHFDPIIPKIN